MSESALRPDSWDGFVGQPDMKHRLEVHIAEAKSNGQALPHVLLVGPPGMGKTSMAKLIADKLGDPFEALDQPLTGKALTNYIYRFAEGVLLLDEIHRYPKGTQEDLMPLIEDGYIRTSGGTGRIYMPDLTIIGATTEPEGIIQPLYDKFHIKPSFDEYDDQDLQTIVLRMAEAAGVEIDEEGAMALGRAAAGTPRNARQFILAKRALANKGLDCEAADVLAFCQTDPDGLSKSHLDYLRTLDSLGGMKGVGLKNICMMVRLNEGVVRDLERLLFQRGLVIPTATGRELTPLGVDKLHRRHIRSAA